MGEWTSLSIGGSEVMHFKNYIPLFVVLLFEKNDLRFNLEETGELDDNDTPITQKSFEFRNTVKKARQILANRGIDEAFCKKAFNDLKAEEVWVSGGDGDDYFEGDVPNTIDYDVYKQLLREKHNYSTDKDESYDELRQYRLLSERLFDSEFPTFFWGDNYLAFEEVIDIVSLRVLLEVAKPEDEVSISLWFYRDNAETLYEDYINLMLKKINFDYSVYGFVIDNDPNLNNRLLSKIQSISDEHKLINQILVPLLKAMGFEGVKPVAFHGQGEFGKDILPFSKRTEFGTVRYLSLQAKSVKIHGTNKKRNNAAEVINQTRTAFGVRFSDSTDNEIKQIDEAIIATNQDITPEAKHFIEQELIGNRRITFIDRHKLVELVKNYNLTQYILFSILED